MQPLTTGLFACVLAATSASAADDPPAVYALGFDQLEYRANRGDDLVNFELSGWIGGDRHKLRAASSGELYTMGRSRGDLEFQLDYSLTLTDSWNAHAGAREDVRYGPGTDRQRTHAVLGLHGLAPLWIEVTPELFVSHDGEASARLALDQSLNLASALVVEPRFELNLAFQNAERFGMRSGATDLELSLRLRYEGWRPAMPYLGVQWRRLLGDTAELARKGGDGVDELGFVAGVAIRF